jgi:hypothetical protein
MRRRKWNGPTIVSIGAEFEREFDTISAVFAGTWSLLFFSKDRGVLGFDALSCAEMHTTTMCSLLVDGVISQSGETWNSESMSDQNMKDTHFWFYIIFESLIGPILHRRVHFSCWTAPPNTITFEQSLYSHSLDIVKRIFHSLLLLI